MAIYDRPVRLLMREVVDTLAPEPRVVFTRQEALDWFAQHYPKVTDGTVSAHLLRVSANSKGCHHYSPLDDEELLFRLDGGRFRRYEPVTDPPTVSEQGSADTDEHDEDVELSTEPHQFAYKSDLRDFLARNLAIFEPGLQLYEEEGITVVEFPVGDASLTCSVSTLKGGYPQSS